MRGTVRVAVALLVGQALLGALIGWLTLGRSPAADGGAAVDHLVAPPFAAPPATSPAPARSSAQPAGGGSSAPAEIRTPATRRNLPAAQRTTTPPPPPPDPPDPSPPLVTGSPELITEPPPAPLPPSATPEVQEPVVIGERCRPPGAFGRTADGIEVRCLPGWHHRPRWKIA